MALPYATYAQSVEWLLEREAPHPAGLQEGLAATENSEASILAHLALAAYYQTRHMPTAGSYLSGINTLPSAASEATQALWHLRWGSYAKAYNQREAALCHTDSAMWLYRQHGDLEGLFISTLHLADYRVDEGQCELASALYLEALELARSSLSPHYEWVATVAYGNGLLHCQKFPKALAVVSPLLEQQVLQTHPPLLATAHYVVGFSHYRLRQQDQDSLHLSKAYHLLSGEIPPGIHKTFVAGMGAMYTARHQFDQAIVYFQQAIDMVEQWGIPRQAGPLYLNRGIAEGGRAWLQKQPLDSAIQTLRTGIDLMKAQLNYESLHTAEAILGGTLYQNKEYEKAFWAMRQAYLNQTRAHEEADSARLEEFFVQYQTQTLKSELLETQLTLSRKERRYTYLIGGLLVSALLVFAVYLLVFIRLQRKRTAEQQRTIELKYSLLRSQMNPHFIFNALNAIQGFFIEQDFPRGNEYLGTFGLLMRRVLEQAREPLIPLSEELETLQMYLQLEQARLQEKLTFEIHVSPEIEGDFVRIPPLILQPFVENAIWHGIAPKSAGGSISIYIDQPTESFLTVRILDDGIGLAASQARKKQQHISRGISVTRDRLGPKGYLNMHTRYDSTGQVVGTQVDIRIPVD